jgi:hypothetical protein
MKLYHFTRPQNLLSIAASGLEPQPPYSDTPEITAGQSVVWLTANPSRDLRPADVQHLSGRGWKRPILFGDEHDVRLTVTFNSTSRRKLYRWADWIAQQAMLNPETGEQYPLAFMSRVFPPSGRDYWICLNRIPVSQIELPPITAGVAMLCLKEDSEPYKQLATMPPDTIVELAA